MQRLYSKLLKITGLVIFWKIFVVNGFRATILSAERTHFSMGIMDVFLEKIGLPKPDKYVPFNDPDSASVIGARCIIGASVTAKDQEILRSLIPEDFTFIHLTEDIANRTLHSTLLGYNEIVMNQIEDDILNICKFDQPVILFSGYANREISNIIMSLRRSSDTRAAFAKAVPNAMPKLLGRLFDEISNDHRERLANFANEENS